MKLNLRQLFEIVGEKKEFTCSFDFSGEELYGGFPFKTPVECSGEIENRAGVVRLVFCVKFVLDLVCDRCLKPFQREENLKFEHILVQKLNTDNDDYLVCADSVLDLEEEYKAMSDEKLRKNWRGRISCWSFPPRCSVRRTARGFAPSAEKT